MILPMSEEGAVFLTGLKFSIVILKQNLRSHRILDTAADLISRKGVSAGTSVILLAALSPKNAWRNAFDSVV
jgi:hypothetical protein